MSALLFSEKKPGDLPCRQVIVELLSFVVTLFDTSGSPPSSLSSSSRGTPSGRPTSVRFDSDPIAGPSRSKIVQDVYDLLTPADPDDKYANHHGFITQAHRPRVFKKWVGELSDMSRDYFWSVTRDARTRLELMIAGLCVTGQTRCGRWTRSIQISWSGQWHQVVRPGALSMRR